MKNEQAKQEAIKKAYGEYWPIVEEFTDLNSGKCHTSFYKPDQKIFDFRELPKQIKENYHFYGQNGYVLPKSIEGIEHNNGWIRIEPDGSNLPKDAETRYRTGTLCFNGDFIPNQFHYAAKDLKLVAATHYKPITPEPKPVY